MNSISNNINFSGRCPQIRDAQWVCHIVNTAYPHVSSTRFSAPMYRLKQENAELYNKFIEISQNKNRRFFTCFNLYSIACFAYTLYSILCFLLHNLYIFLSQLYSYLFSICLSFLLIR